MKVCVFTATHGEYRPFADLLRLSLEMSYPEFDFLPVMECKDLSPMRRFLEIPDIASNYDQCFIMDSDFLIFRSEPSHLWWYLNNSGKMAGIMFSTHGPLKKPERFPGGWTGDKERVAGGMVMITPRWIEKTRLTREGMLAEMEAGLIGNQYREEDEVMLCRICKLCHIPICQDKVLPAQYRCIHLGDFKPSMSHRFLNLEKMKKKIFRPYVDEYRNMVATKEWVNLESYFTPIVRNSVDNLNAFISSVGW